MGDTNGNGADKNGFSKSQKAIAGGSIIAVFLMLCVGLARWGEWALTTMINHANEQVAVERQRSDEREQRSREHGDKAVELMGAKLDKQTDRLEKALHTQTMQADRWQQKMIEMQKELIRKADQANGGNGH